MCVCMLKHVCVRERESVCVYAYMCVHAGVWMSVHLNFYQYIKHILFYLNLDPYSIVNIEMPFECLT